MPGPRPKPSHLKLVTGNPGKRAVNKNEPRPLPLPKLPPAPAHLDLGAKKEWKRIAPLLFPIGLLTGVDIGALEGYCIAYSRWKTAEAALAVMAKSDPQFSALMIKTKSGNAIQNPLVGVANKAMEDMRKFAAEFGMTPSARSRINADSPGQPPKGEQYF